MADRYTGRHIRQAREARHGAWVTKKRTRSKPAQLVPTAAAFTVAGVLIGGAGTVIQLASPALADEVDAPTYDADGRPLTDRVPTHATRGGWVGQNDAGVTRFAAMTAAGPAPAAANRAAERTTANAPTTGTTVPVVTGSTPTTPTTTETPTDTTTGSTTTGSTTTDSTGTDTTTTDTTPDAVTEGSCSATPAESTAEETAGDLTAASSTLPAGSEVLVTNEATGDSVVVVITSEADAGCLSLSPAAFAEVAPLGTNIVDVHYAVLVEDAT